MKSVLGLAVVLCVAISPALAQHCSNASLRGTYTYAFEPYFAGGAGPAAAVIGTVSFDGKGNLHGMMTQNFGGGAVATSFQGTYAVNADCTYASEFGGSTQVGIVAQQGDRIHVLNADATGLILEFTAEREKKSSERCQ